MPDVDWADFDRRDQAFRLVEPLYQRVIAADPDIFDPTVLAQARAGIQMLVATRYIDAQVDNGGWPAVFYNEADSLLEAAIAGYRLLGLDEHARVARLALEHGWTVPTDETPDDPVWDSLAAEWFGLPDSEVARAEYIRAHAAEFESGEG